MAFATSKALNNMTLNMASSTTRSSTYSPVSQPSCSPRCLLTPPLHRRHAARAPVVTAAYRNGNCQDSYRRGFAWGPFMMGPDAAMAGAALADMARRFANSNAGGFSQNMENAPLMPLLVDLLETEDQYLLTADVPGLQKSDLKITVNQKERSLKITGERKRSGDFTEEAKEKVDGEEQQQKKFRRQFERRVGKFQRVFSMIPENADLSSVAARVDKGILTVTIQKTIPAESDDTMDINIE